MHWDDKTGECKLERMGFREPIGPENWRNLFYGSDAVESLGLTLIPSLAKNDVYAGGEELDQLEREAKIMLDNLAFIVSQTGNNEQTYAQRLRYILEAIEFARPLQAHVVLW